ISFILLFVLYHLAEYMLMFNNNIPLFFTFQILFFGAAILLGNWYSKNGLSAWGLPLSRKIITRVLLGIVLGFILYAIPYWLSIRFGIEKITAVPSIKEIIKNSLPFTFGVLLTSFSEDILTRGLIFSHLHGKIKPLYLILLSATIYLLNHIYRLNDGPDVLLYIFLLGVVFFIPLMNSKNLWITGAMHWTGNVVFFVSHNIIQTQEIENTLSYNYLFSIFLCLMIPAVWIITKRYRLKTEIADRNVSSQQKKTT
ncbi:MAG: type II CAAX endopeptidase family protein, partial [Gillisia sp.]